MTFSIQRAARTPLGWMVVLVVLVGVISFGSLQPGGPQTQEDRVDDITSQVACPICDGESVFESRNAASRAIRNKVDSLVRDNDLTDDQILLQIENTYGSEIMLVPDSTGLDAVAWIAPVVVFVLALAALVAAFVRWKRLSDLGATPSPQDRLLVSTALDDPRQNSRMEVDR